MMSSVKFSFRNPSRVLAIMLGLVLSAATPARLLLAQPFAGPAQPVGGQDRGTTQRVVHGKVEDKSGAPIKGAVVYLKDDRSSQVKSAISVEDGSYRFVQLTFNTDYELWAQSDSKRSKTRSISSFDSKPDLDITLQIDK